MTNYPYIAPCSYFLIYAYEIPRSVDHVGRLRIGMMSFKSSRPMLSSQGVTYTPRRRLQW